VSRYQKGKTNLDFTEARDSEWQWHYLGHMQVCTLLQTDNHTSTRPLSFFTGRMPFLPPNQQCHSTEGRALSDVTNYCLNAVSVAFVVRGEERPIKDPRKTCATSGPAQVNLLPAKHRVIIIISGFRCCEISL